MVNNKSLEKLWKNPVYYSSQVLVSEMKERNKHPGKTLMELLDMPIISRKLAGMVNPMLKLLSYQTDSNEICNMMGLLAENINYVIENTKKAMVGNNPIVYGCMVGYALAVTDIYRSKTGLPCVDNDDFFKSVSALVEQNDPTLNAVAYNIVSQYIECVAAATGDLKGDSLRIAPDSFLEQNLKLGFDAISLDREVIGPVSGRTYEAGETLEKHDAYRLMTPETYPRDVFSVETGSIRDNIAKQVLLNYFKT